MNLFFMFQLVSCSIDRNPSKGVELRLKRKKIHNNNKKKRRYKIPSEIQCLIFLHASQILYLREILAVQTKQHFIIALYLFRTFFPESCLPRDHTMESFQNFQKKEKFITLQVESTVVKAANPFFLKLRFQPERS